MIFDGMTVYNHNLISNSNSDNLMTYNFDAGRLNIECYIYEMYP